MNAPASIQPVTRLTRRGDSAQLIADATEILDRTSRIVRRLMPDTPTPHGFRDPQGFVAASRYSGQRSQLFQQVQRRITAKVMARGVAA